MSGSLVPISDAQANLFQEVVKAFRGVGSFVVKALGSTPEDLIGYLGGDWLRVRRAENVVKLMLRSQQRLAERKVTEFRAASLSVALPILQGAADEDRDELIDLWARLLANAMTPSLDTVRHKFIDTIKQLDPIDAVVLTQIYKYEARLISLIEDGAGDGELTIKAIARDIARRDDEVIVSILHLKQLDFLDERGDGGQSYWYVNAVFREFMRACFPEFGAKEK